MDLNLAPPLPNPRTWAGYFNSELRTLFGTRGYEDEDQARELAEARWKALRPTLKRETLIKNYEKRAHFFLSRGINNRAFAYFDQAMNYATGSDRMRLEARLTETPIDPDGQWRPLADLTKLVSGQMDYRRKVWKHTVDLFITWLKHTHELRSQNGDYPVAR